MNARRYQLIETLPYPQAANRGHLTDCAGAPLHGVYERATPYGFRAALVNNGTPVHRYDYPASLVNQPQPATRSFGNLVHTLRPWLVGAAAERPVTNYPATEYPYPVRRSMWNEPIILESILRGTKRVGLLAGTPSETDGWTSRAEQHGLVVRTVLTRTMWDGQLSHTLMIARPGWLVTEQDLDELHVEYARQVPAHRMRMALAELARMSGETLNWQRLTSPRDTADLVASGCFGYPVASTVAVIRGTHG